MTSPFPAHSNMHIVICSHTYNPHWNCVEFAQTPLVMYCVIVPLTSRECHQILPLGSKGNNILCLGFSDMDRSVSRLFQGRTGPNCYTALCTSYLILHMYLQTCCSLGSHDQAWRHYFFIKQACWGWFTFPTGTDWLTAGIELKYSGHFVWP